jgi:outer membrane receptor protein involved in Fe transport
MPRPVCARPRSVAVTALGVLAPAIVIAAAGPADPASGLEEIVVTASLLGETQSRIAASTTVLTAETLQSAGLQHFGDVLGLVPNLNWSGGTSRPRFFQLRGIGELEQYQGAPNPSVGFLLDEIDLSGIGMPATLFDTEQVEVLRGPQGTRFGANALAGLIKVKTRDATPTPEFEVEGTYGDHDTVSLGAVAGGAVGQDGSAWRIAGQRYRSDGFMRNVWLDRDDTNGRDESTLRGKLRVALPADWQADVAALYVDLDNGFDAFVPDNSRRTLSDRPGRDAQRTRGGSLTLAGPAVGLMLTSSTAYAGSDSVYSFDGDWGNDPYWGEFAPYDYFSNYQRERTTVTQDLRVAGTGGAMHWVAGLYALRLAEDTLQRDEFAGVPWREPLASEYDATSLAAYGESRWRPGEGSVEVTAGLRLEQRDADYEDSDGASFDPRDTMLGGQLSIAGPAGDTARWYATVARGYKAGGFNIGQAVPADRRQFEPEFLWNVEGGLRATTRDARFGGEVSVFHMWREQQQVATSFQLDPGDPLSYVFYTDNAARGRNYGLEASGQWRPLDRLALQATLGLLASEYVDYRYDSRDLDGRDQAHAPNWQYSLSAQWGGAEGWRARADLFGSDAFYFDASHDQRSEPYALLNLRAGYARGAWSADAWVRNVTDETYAVRGFYFGLEPPDFPDRLYVQRGEGRLIGFTVQWRWQ